jgi:hypothetical protein
MTPFVGAFLRPAEGKIAPLLPHGRRVGFQAGRDRP